MAHIPDGILSAPVLIGGGVVAAAGVALGLRRLDDRMIPRTAILAAAFFAGSLVAVPVGPASVHLLLAALMGIMLGTATFPAVLVALLLQALLFGFGGLTTLGINTVNIALPGVVFGMMLGPVIRATERPALRFAAGALAGALAVLGTGGLVALSLWMSSSDYTPVASVVIATYLPLALGEAFVTAAIVSFLARVQPDALRPVAP
ncbi:cobalt transporter CbiM [Ancylobacter dichloromethanicus]|uniref:Cobalt transporter CbiM n=1 Tax=Ancylobacter dichloromethanicus TaxID=518825 RepID=A0A9W6J3J7_9HYPH|nr:cobalt transporter CbiM [Ancylobacter dichloromethanicus]MBS7556276.1 cobalt transporter CbiM [Ancylobacter dichloromethanicus]GLK70037.1 cobalt transporter CbiM [Ancylobacter dichloromethanicus]